MTEVPPKGWKLIRDSFSKLVVWFKDGNIRTFYSIDWKSRYDKNRDRNIGLQRFRKMLDTWGAKSETSEIYDKSSGKLLEKYFEGKKIENKHFKEKN